MHSILFEDDEADKHDNDIAERNDEDNLHLVAACVCVLFDDDQIHIDNNDDHIEMMMTMAACFRV